MSEQVVVAEADGIKLARLKERRELREPERLFLGLLMLIPRVTAMEVRHG